MNVTCEQCSTSFDASDFSFDETLTCPSCNHRFASPQQDLGALNVTAGDFDQLLQAENDAPTIPAPQQPKQQPSAKDAKTESLLRAYGAGQEKLRKHLSKDAAEKVDRGLRLHFVATVAFTLFLFFSSLGVGAFLATLTVGAYVQESAAMKKDMNLTREVRSHEKQQHEFFLKLAAILAVTSVVCFILGTLPLFASIAVDFLSLVGCLSFPEEHGAKLLQIVAGVFRGLSALAFVGGLAISLLLGATLAASLFIAVGVALLPLVVAWGCFCASLGQVGVFLQREEFVSESRRLLVMGFTTMLILIAVPIVSFVLIASGNGIWLIVIVSTALTVFFLLLRLDPVAYFINFGLYLTSLKFSFAYANYLQSLREVISRSHKPDDTPKFLKPI
jgi:hypothetical protein